MAINGKEIENGQMAELLANAGDHVSITALRKALPAKSKSLISSG